MIALSRKGSGRWSILAVALLVAAGCTGLTNPLATAGLQTVETELYTVNVPSDWTVEPEPGEGLAFAADGKNVGGVEVLGCYADQPEAQALPNHAEVLSFGPVEGLAGSARWCRLKLTESAAAGSERAVEQYHIYYFAPDRQMALDFRFDPALVEEKAAVDIVKTVVLAGDSIGAAVEEKLAKIISNESAASASNPYVYIAASQTEFDALVALGEKSLQYMVAQLGKAKEDGLRELIMAAACSEIRGETGKDWHTGKEWYDRYLSGSGRPDTGACSCFPDCPSGQDNEGIGDRTRSGAGRSGRVAFHYQLIYG